MSSASAINELSRSKSRYQHQDQLLQGFYMQPNSTAKEIAAEVFDWKYELYGDSPKRATDLSSDRLGYLELVGNRVCRRSGKDAHIYRITDKGIQHLQKIGLLSAMPERVNPVSTGAGIAGLRAAVGL